MARRGACGHTGKSWPAARPGLELILGLAVFCYEIVITAVNRGEDFVKAHQGRKCI